MNTGKSEITINAQVRVPVKTAWHCWTIPEHIMQWSHANDDWHTPRASNDLRQGGKFLNRMEAKDGSFGFDFEGVYDEVIPDQLIRYTMPDDRKVCITFVPEENGKVTMVTVVFEAESENSIEHQTWGWQAILDNFKKYAESNI